MCGEFTSHRWVPQRRPMTRSFDVSFDMRLNKRLNKHSRHRWFEMPSCSLWRHYKRLSKHSRHRWFEMPSCPLWRHCNTLDMGHNKQAAKSLGHENYSQYRINTLRWRHNGNDSVSNHQPQDCLLNRLFGHRSKKTWKLRVTGFCVGNSPGTGEFPAQMASNAENVSIWWRHHDAFRFVAVTSRQCRGVSNHRSVECLPTAYSCWGLNK